MTSPVRRPAVVAETWFSTEERTVAQMNRAVSRPARGAAGEHVVEGGLDAFLEGAGGLPHPEDHPGDHGDGDQGEGAADDLLGLEGEGLGAPREQGAEGEREAGGQGDADPHLGEDVSTVGAHEVGGDDADDERGLEALAEGDEEVGDEHGAPAAGCAGGPWERAGRGAPSRCDRAGNAVQASLT